MSRLDDENEEKLTVRACGSTVCVACVVSSIAPSLMFIISNPSGHPFDVLLS